MAPDRAAAGVCTCLWSGGGGDRDGRSTSRRWTNTGRRALHDVSAACEVGCRHHPSPGLGDTSSAGTKAMSGLPSGSQVRSSGPWREQSSSLSGDTASRGVPVAQAPGLPVLVAGRRLRAGDSGRFPVSQSPRSGLWGDDGEGCRGGLEHVSSRWRAPRSPWCATPSGSPPPSMVSSCGLVRVRLSSASPGPGFG